MRNRLWLGVLLLGVLISPPAAACQYWKCYESATTATCSYFFCNGAGCNEAYYAVRCSVTCDYMSGGGCFCDTEGTDCYQV